MSWTKLDLFSDKRKIEELFLSLPKTILPKRDEIFNAYRFTKHKDVRVVILGQDPYPTPGHAHGLAFSVRPNISLPRSLENVFKEMKDDIGGCPSNGCLIPWAQQGVFLLNTALTVLPGRPNSHKDIWKKHTDETINLVSRKEYPIVFVLWGRQAQEAKQCIENKNRHIILESSHPSPFSANKGFFNSKPFSRVNKYIQGEEIVWNLSYQNFC